jgi:hypothetical protein
MTSMMILTLQLSTFLFYAVTYHFHLLMVCIYLPVDSIRKSMYAYEDFSKRRKLLTNTLILQGYNESLLNIVTLSSFVKITFMNAF